MALAALLALTMLADGPSSAPPPTTTVDVASASPDDVPPGAPTDDYRFVAWCYGAMDESIAVYQAVLPELKAIDARIGSPVKEAVPYAEDVAGERLALKRFAAAMEAAERASPRPIAPDGVTAMAQGRMMWSQAKLQPPRQLAHAWLLWGSPERCETTAKSLKAKATLLGQAMAIGAPVVEPPAPRPAAPPPPPPAPTPALTIDSVLDSAASAPTKPEPTARGSARGTP